MEIAGAGAVVAAVFAGSVKDCPDGRVMAVTFALSTTGAKVADGTGFSVWNNGVPSCVCENGLLCKGCIITFCGRADFTALSKVVIRLPSLFVATVCAFVPTA